MSRALVIVAVVAAALGGAAPQARTELISSRPITIVIPFTPGASADTLQRIVGRKVSEDTGQILVFESRPGGGGVIGATTVKTAAPDGQILLQANAGTHGANPALYASLPYDPIKDFRPITLLWSFPQLLAVPFDSPAKSVADLVALAATKPGGLSFASQGTGSAGHLIAEMFKARTGAHMVHVPYRGAGPAALDLAAARVDFFFASYSSLHSFLQANKVRPLAVTAPRRMPSLPDTPTMREVGFEGVELDAWFGFMAPAGTPDAVIDKLNAAFVRAVHDPAVTKQLAEQGADPLTSTPAEFARFISTEIARFDKIVKAVGVKIEQ